MKRCLIVVALLMVAHLVCVPHSHAQTEDQRIKRLIGLARIWNSVKYFHPFLAYRDIDWDKALVDTIPKVNNAKSPEEYRKAIDSMLSVLNDKATFAEIPGEPKPKPTQDDMPPNPQPIRINDGVLIVDVTSIARILAADQFKYPAIFQPFDSLLPQARGVIFDCRANFPTTISSLNYGEYAFNDTLHRFIPRLLDHDISLGMSRFRLHNGYTPQQGGSSGDYFSGIVSEALQTVSAKGNKSVPFGFVINDNTPDVYDLIGGLHGAGVAAIVQEGEVTRTFGSISRTIQLPDGVSVSVRVIDIVNPDGSVGFQPDVKTSKGSSDAALAEAEALLARPRSAGSSPTAAEARTIAGPKDKPYAEMKFPDPSYRLLALFRFWGVIDNFYPNKDLIGDTWKTVLERFIPKFEGDKNTLEYQATVSELATEIHDSHGFIRGASELDADIGTYMPPVLLRYVGGKPVVERVLDEKTLLKAGDTIVSIDAETAEHRREYLARFIPASTPQALSTRVALALLRGQKDSVTDITVRGVDGELRRVKLVRSLFQYDQKVFDGTQRKTPMVELLPDNIGYADLTRLQVSDVDEMFKKLGATRAIVFDMRGYPNGTAWSIAPRLTDRTNVAAALFSRPILSGRTIGVGDYEGSELYTFRQPLPKREGDVYRGKVVMLIDETAISQAEHTCLFFEAATNVTFVGTSTTGANGDVSNLVLPGGVYVSFSGQTVRHIDGRQLQRLGIQPTIPAAPTAAGIAAGRDEVLEAALKFLRSRKK